jgi:hypothetical protein
MFFLRSLRSFAAIQIAIVGDPGVAARRSAEAEHRQAVAAEVEPASEDLAAQLRRISGWA